MATGGYRARLAAMSGEELAQESARVVDAALRRAWEACDWGDERHPRYRDYASLGEAVAVGQLRQLGLLPISGPLPWWARVWEG